MGSPTYRNIGDHTETVQIDYDPSRISYHQLLDIFWQSHQPTSQSWSRQYLHAVFYHNDEQRLEAEASKTALEKKIGHQVKTKVLPVRSFTLAEEYHQKYILKGQTTLFKDLKRKYPRHEDIVNSTAAARLNGYVGGHGNKDQLSREIDEFDLSDGAKQALIRLVGK